MWLTLFSVLAFVHLDDAAMPIARHGCAVANKAIWCFGGFSRVFNHTLDGRSSALTKLDLSSFDFFNLQFDWQIMTPSNFALDECNSPSMVSTQSGFVIFGGYGLNYIQRRQPVITYNSQSNAWAGFSALPSEWNGTYPMSTPVLDFDGKMWVYGGFFTDAFLGGPPDIQLFDYVANTWSSINAVPPGNRTRRAHTASLSNDGSTIYIIGGKSMYPGQPLEHDLDMTEVWMFMTTNAQWITINASSDKPIVNRQFHTAVMGKRTRLIFIYGGWMAKPPPDAAYYPIINGTDVALMYDYSAHRFYTPVIQGSNSPGPRMYHASVLYTDGRTNSSFVSILFGLDENFELQSSTYFLNVTNPSNLTWVANTSHPGDFPAGGIDSSSSSSTSSGGSLSTGAIAGIAVGAAALAIVGCIASLCLYHRHRKNKQDFEVQQADPRADMDEVCPPADHLLPVVIDGASKTSDSATARSSSATAAKPEKSTTYCDVKLTTDQNESIKPTAVDRIKPTTDADEAIKPFENS
ncbi:hypothetical protein BC940DRAFT_360950 [Gongronella butleri]|nr:hypothetical protein BC940DRAFT_360950 [Gongronella butleri]